MKRLRVFAALGVLSAFELTVPAPAEAARHPLIHSTAWAHVARERVSLRVRVTLEEPVMALRLRPGADERFGAEPLRAAIEAYAPYLLAHLRVRADGKPLCGRLLHGAPASDLRRSFLPLDLKRLCADYAFEYPLDRAALPAEISFEQDVLREFEYGPGRPWEVTYILAVDRAEGGTRQNAFLRRERPFVLATAWKDCTAAPPAASLSSTPASPPDPVRLPDWAFALLLAALAAGVTLIRRRLLRRALKGDMP